MSIAREGGRIQSMVRQAHPKSVRVRIAPSPTGFAHVGTAYSALFNYAFARKNKGEFILRLEDTDVKRNVQGAEGAIYEGLAWLGLSWDEGADKGGKYGPYRQSERLSIYKKYAEDFLKQGKAYKEDAAVRFKNPGDDVSWTDMVRDEITFPGGEVGDFVLLKSDGYPTYNFGVVIDDLLMKITHVIRGEEHISNTPRQLALYKALDATPPLFAHLPTLRNKERKKLSKRKDPVDLRIYQKDGYLAAALVNFLCLLGWSHPDEKEIFSLEEFVNLFSLDRVRKAGPIFDADKLDWMNGIYIRQLTVDEFNDKLQITNDKWKKVDQTLLKAVAPLVKERIKKLSEFEDLAGFFFERKKIDNKLLGKSYKLHLNAAVVALGELAEWKETSLNARLLALVKEKGFKTGEFFMDLRIAITGSRVTPPINESIVILGKEETLTRLRQALT